MNEDIKKNELRDDELKNVSGGYYGEGHEPNCEKCGTKMYFIIKGAYYDYDCPNCGHSVPVPF